MRKYGTEDLQQGHVKITRLIQRRRVVINRRPSTCLNGKPYGCPE
jgi:hypothetical protein